MAAFIDTTYFKNWTQVVVPNNSNAFDFDKLMEQVQETYLIELMGFDLYYNFITGLAEDPILQKWIDIRDGKIYQYENDEGTLVYSRWIGLKNSDKKSFIANFTVYELNQLQKSKISRGGKELQSLENAQYSDFTQQYMKIYNDGITMYNSLIDFIERANLDDDTTYPNFTGEKMTELNYFGI